VTEKGSLYVYRLCHFPSLSVPGQHGDLGRLKKTRPNPVRNRRKLRKSDKTAKSPEDSKPVDTFLRRGLTLGPWRPNP